MLWILAGRSRLDSAKASQVGGSSERYAKGSEAGPGAAHSLAKQGREPVTESGWNANNAERAVHLNGHPQTGANSRHAGQKRHPATRPGKPGPEEANGPQNLSPPSALQAAEA